MFNHLNVQRAAARVPWDTGADAVRPGWLTRWWAGVITRVLDGYDPTLPRRLK